MKKRFKEISRSVVNSDKCISERIVSLNEKCMKLNDIFSETLNNHENQKELLKELAKKTIEIGLMAESISFELYLSNVIEMKELNGIKEKTLKIVDK